MIISPDKQSQLVTRKYPFLQNFPFGEFAIEIGEMPKSPTFLFDEDSDFFQAGSIDPKLVKFGYGKDKTKIAIVIFEKELYWINDIADKVKDLDKISKILDKGLKSKDLLVKRNAVEAAEDWCNLIQDNRTSLSYSTMSEILASMIGDRFQMVRILNQLGQLTMKTGLVSLAKDEYQVILTYYHCQLVYTKLILGLVIASKISI